MTIAFKLGFATALLAVAGYGHAVVAHSEGFEDPAWVANMPDNWQNFSGATITRATSGTNGIASSDGAAHATLSVGSGPFTRFGGYSSDFGSGFSTSLDVYLDPTWSDGQGFDYSVAASNQAGGHLRDFIFHVGVVGGALLVNASNNTDATFNSFKLTNENGGNYHTLASAGWYTLQQMFRNDGGVLAVDMNLLDDGGNLLYSVTRTNAADDIATTVGGNRYGWFTYNNIANLAIDNTALAATGAQVPEPGSLALIALGMVALGASARRRRSQAAA